MTNDVPGPSLENRVALFLDATDHVWACRSCIVRTLELTVRGVKMRAFTFEPPRGRAVDALSFDIDLETGECTCTNLTGSPSHSRNQHVSKHNRGRIRRPAKQLRPALRISVACGSEMQCGVRRVRSRA